MKKNITIAILLLFTIYLNPKLYSQDVAYYIRIEDKGLVKKISKNSKTKDIIIETDDIEFKSILKKHRVKAFKKALPKSKRIGANKLYLVLCNDSTLGDELKTKMGNKISGVYRLNGGVTYTPNDYGLAMGQSNLDLINAKDAWDICKDLPKITIGVSDTYFDLNHEDLDLTHFGGNNSSMDDHGTKVAGCISAISDNGIGLASVAYNAELFVHTDFGPWGGDSAVYELAQAGHRVINCSWIVNCDYIPEMDTFYQDIRNDFDALVVFGAGNSRTLHCGNNNPSYPASYESNIAVTSVGHMHSIGSSQSPFDDNNWIDVHEEVIGDSLTAHKHHPTMDICAPGYNISTTDIMGTGGASNGNYTNDWGTSFAAPQVSATLGLIISVNPCLDADEAADILLNNTDDGIYDIPENQQYIGRLGTGRLDVYAAVNAAAESATTYLNGLTLTGNQVIEDNYAIRITDNVTLASSANIELITRKEVTIDKNFTVPVGSTFEIDVDVNNIINCN